MIDTIKSLLTKAPRGLSEGESLMWNITGGRVVPKRGSAELVGAYKNTPWLRSVCSRVATSVASTRWEVLVPKRGSDGKAKRYKQLARTKGAARQKTVACMKRAGDLVALDEHPILDLLHHGNKFLPGHSSLEVSQLHLDIQGEAFWFLDKLGKMPFAFWPIPPNWVSKVPTPDEPWFTLQFSGSRYDVPADMVLWFRYPDPGNPYGRGTGIAESMGDELDTDEYATKYIKGFFANNGVPDAMVSMKGASKEALAAAKAAWESRYRGAHNAHQMAWHNGEIDLQVLSQTFKDQQMVELRTSVRDTIIQIFGVPPECVGVIDNSNRATIEAAMYIMAVYVTVPRLERFRDVLQDRLVPMFDEALILDYESPVPDDKAFRLEVMKAQPSAVSRAEWREAAGLESHGPVDDVYLMEPGKSERAITDSELWNDQGGAAPLDQNAPGAQGDDDPAEDPDEPGDEDEEYEDEDEDEEDDLEKYARSRKARRKATENDIEQTLLALEAEPLTKELDPVISDMVKEWGSKQLAALGISGSFNMLNPRVVEHLNAVGGDKIVKVNQTTKDAIRATLIDGVKAGEGSRELAARVRSVFDEASSTRATRIARTEVVGSSNFANFEAMVQAGIVQTKQWAATPDDRTRESHADLNGQVRGLHDEFEINGMAAMHPGGFGEPEEDINCRCAVIPVISTPKSVDELRVIWKTWDEGLRPYEKQARAAMRRGFAVQRDAVLDALYDAIS